MTTNVTVQDELGNVDCEQNIQDITNYTQSAQYCQSGTYFLADLGTFLTQFGNAQNSKVVTSLTINMTAGEYCTVDIEGHNHDTNAHVAGLSLGYSDVSGFLPAGVGEAFENWNGFGVPDFEVTTGANASPISATVTFNMNHVDQIDESGSHLVGKNITPRAEMTMEFSGVPTSNTITLLEADLVSGTYVDSIDNNDSNSDFDSFAFTAHKHYALAT